MQSWLTRMKKMLVTIATEINPAKSHNLSFYTVTTLGKLFNLDPNFLIIPLEVKKKNILASNS